jgi:pilus assembly protein CpaB
MNTSRIIILGVAALAAGAAAFLARGLLGGGTEKVKAAALPPPVTNEVLVASSDLQPGAALTTDSVHWQNWPKSSIDSSFVTQTTEPDINHIVTGAVLRAPVVAGQPITPSMMVHADTAGFMAAMVTPGMRAVSIATSTETGAGGFILPNDRVDVIVTVMISDQPKRYGARTLLNDVRVLAVDQTYKEDKDQKAVLAKTATLELTEKQAELVERAASTGSLSLSLRGLGDNSAGAQAIGDTSTQGQGQEQADAGPVAVLRYNIPRVVGSPKE